MSKKNLVIVESPAKAKTIAKYLGSDFQVESSFGHIRDLPKSKMSVDIEDNFTPKYVVPRDKTKVVNSLKKSAKNVETVWLASDEDREGEAIAWHLAKALELDPDSTKRIVFHEITESAIKAAVASPRTIDNNLVDAQQARRVLDRLVGYELSPVLWKKVKRGLSAGRVQSVAVRLIVEREQEIEAFEGDFSYKVSLELEYDHKQFSAELATKLKSKDEVEKFMHDLLGSELSVDGVEKKPATRNPGAPFTTSTLQQEASSRLGFSVKRTMSLAQRLYESGHITYMRTDSVTLSSQATSSAKSVITKKFGANYHNFRQFKTKASGAQEAHEAIRPTNLSKDVAGSDEPQKKLYNLIWQRTLASQMASAKIERTEATIAASGSNHKIIAKGEQIDFDGFLALVGTKSVNSQILPDLKKSDKVDLISAEGKQQFSKPPARYTEASLVRKLEDLGIGRPSTYAPTISTIQDRNYVQKGDSEGVEREIDLITLVKGNIKTEKINEKSGSTKGKLLPTDMGRLVTKFLVKHFSDIVDYSFTAKVEADFDKIAHGEEKWQAMLADFYKDFHPHVEKAEDIDASETGSRRLIGKHPKSGLPVFARYGRYGPMIQIGDTADKEEKPQFLPMPKGESIETITLESALSFEALPRDLGESDTGEPIMTNIGPYGPYVKVGSKFISLSDEYDPLTIDLETAKKVIAEQAKKNAPIAEFGKIQVLRGRYGPYVKEGKINARIPKGVKPEEIDEATAKELIEKAKARKKK